MFRIFKWFKNRKRKNIDEGLNVVEGISKAKKLYKELIVKSHPDRHPNNIEKALEITELLNQNRYNYRELLKLKERILNEL